MNLATLECRDEPRQATPLPGPQAITWLGELDGWRIENDALCRTLRCVDFRQAMDLAHHIAEMAEAPDHHPELVVGWGSCQVRWTTHDAGGLTRRDFICAAKVDALVRGLEARPG